MVEPEDYSEVDPVLQPHLVRFLRERPKLIDVEMREKVLKGVEENIKDRRRPGYMAERIAEAAADIGKPVLTDATRERLEKANGKVLKRF